MFSRQINSKLINMKYLMVILVAFASFNSMAQEKKKEVQMVKSASVEKDVTSKTLSKENKAIYVSGGTKSVKPERTIEYYNNVITALNIKIKYIKSDPAENEKAIETGWFDKMDKLLLKAKEEKAKLQSSKK